MDILGQITDAVFSGNAPKTEELTKEAVTQGINPQVIIDNGLIAGMNKIGVLFKESKVFIPEVLISVRAMNNGMKVLKPLLVGGKSVPKGKAVIGTVKGDLHDIGKNLVIMMLEGAGFEVVDIGVDKAPEIFVEAVKEHSPDILGMSALLTTTLPAAKDTVTALQDAGLRDKVKVMIGGAPVTQKIADEIGADGFAPDASCAVDLAKQLIGVN